MSRRPNFIIAGAQKSGTSWLHMQLRQHPDVFMPEHKELNFFNQINAGKDEALQAEYLQYFETATTQKCVGEATPHYFWRQGAAYPYAPNPDYDVATNIYDMLGADTDIVISLRDPVSRAVSAYYHNFSMGRNPDRIGILNCPVSMGLVDLGFYKRHWLHYYKFFGADRLHVVLYDTLKSAPESYLRQVLIALGLERDEAYLASLNLTAEVNTRRGLMEHRSISADTAMPRIEPSDVKSLLALYQDDIQFVEMITGEKLPHWRDEQALIRQHCS